MLFVSLLLMVMTSFVFIQRIRFRRKAILLTAKVVGYECIARSLYNIRIYAYRLRVEYEGRVYIAQSFEAIFTAGGYPDKHFDRMLEVYFTPNQPKRVSVRRTIGLMFICVVLFF